MARSVLALVLGAVLIGAQATTEASAASATGCDLTPAGDLADVMSNPTDLGAFCLGTNTVSGTIDVGDLLGLPGLNVTDYWEAALPTGYQIDRIGMQINDIVGGADFGYYETTICYGLPPQPELSDCRMEFVDGFYLFEGQEFPVTPPRLTFFAANGPDRFPDGTAYDYRWEIHVSLIPIPAGAWLFGSALGLLGWLKRRTA